MQKQVELWLSPREAATLNDFKPALSRKLNLPKNRINHYQLIKKSIDARGARIKMRLVFDVFIDELPDVEPPVKTWWPRMKSGKRMLVIGAGPAGLFAALRLIELGIKPIVIERGKDVSGRKADVATMNRPQTAGFINADSNYCFGEGGAGTFSDGKLYTRSTKRGDVGRILKILTDHGAHPEIMYDAHPHIGSDKLPGIITAIRNTILDAGGEVHFSTRMSGLIIDKGELKGIRTHGGLELFADAVILATGHSAHDVYEMLLKENILLESKPFALGVRAEHPQALIDSIQYKTSSRGEYLPAASYKLVQQVEGRGVFSFCMCPGGIVVPATTEPGYVVVNGMSNSKRNSPYANSGIVVTVNPEDLTAFEAHGALKGLAFQQEIEKACFVAGGGAQTAPAQRLVDFVDGKLSSSLPSHSYNPGATSAPLHEILPPFVAHALQKGFIEFGKKMKGYFTNEAVLFGTESRTSSPVRMPRDPISLEHIGLKRLFPAGEGAGYAGGIVSSAMDGENCAQAAARLYGV